MTDGILHDLTVIEGSAFVAAPLGGMTLAQLGADVIRFDQIGGGLDRDRWPLAAGGQSLFWAGLNKGKRSIEVDLHSDEGRELVTALVAAAGNLLTNFPARGWLAYDALRARRDDLVMVALTGNPDGTSEVDYTVNPATGFPFATGPRDFAGPLNSVLPAWDAVMGGLAATGLLAADRHRARTGEGNLIRLALSDVAFAMVGHLGRVAEAELGGRDMRRDGNYLYGAFGHDFETADGRRVMVVALTPRQWKALLDATGLRRADGQDRRGDRVRSRHRDGTLRGPRLHRGGPASVVRRTEPGRDPQVLRRYHGLVGSLPDLHAAGRRGSARSRPTTQSGSESSTPASGPTGCRARRSASPMPNAFQFAALPCSESTPKRSSANWRASARSRSGAYTMRESSAVADRDGRGLPGPWPRSGDTLQDGRGQCRPDSPRLRLQLGRR